MRRAPDALHAAGDRRRRLDLDDEVDRAMSIPSSRVEVATRAGSLPDLRASSISTRCALAIEPWCAWTSVSPASSLSAAAILSARRRELTKMSVEVCARMSSRRRGWMAGQMELRPGLDAAGPLGMSTVGSPSLAISSTGTSTVRESCLRSPVSTMVTGRKLSGAAPAAPPKKRATSSRGCCVADSPILCGGRSHNRDSRSSDSARCAPRLFGVSAWISSTMIVSTERSVSRAFDVNIR